MQVISTVDESAECSLKYICTYLFSGKFRWPPKIIVCFIQLFLS